jgi:hypothetical protein
MQTINPPNNISRMRAAALAAITLLGLVSASLPASAQDPNPAPPLDKEAQAKRRPRMYLTVFNNGYGGDTLPVDPAQFEKLVKTLSGQGNFNAVMCTYTAERLAICKKHGIRMIVDLLGPEHHVYKNAKACEELCTRLRNDPTVAAYHLWSDKFGKQGAGRERDINNIHQWDPTHATYSGTYMNGGINYLATSDFISYYDFAWKRGIQNNFPHLLGAWNQARIHDNRLGRYVECDAGLPGKGNFNRSLFTQNTSIACGLRAVLWFIGSGQMNMQSLEFNEAGLDAAKVNAWLKPLWLEIPKLGLPTAIHATPVTRDYNDRPVAATGQPVYASGLENCAIPKDFWIQPVSGEFVMGVSKYNGTAADAIFLANLNAYAAQDVKLKLTKPVKAAIFSRETGKYVPLQQTAGELAFKLEPAGAALVRFE